MKYCISWNKQNSEQIGAKDGVQSPNRRHHKAQREQAIKRQPNQPILTHEVILELGITHYIKQEKKKPENYKNQFHKN